MENNNIPITITDISNLNILSTENQKYLLVQNSLVPLKKVERQVSLLKTNKTNNIQVLANKNPISKNQQTNCNVLLLTSAPSSIPNVSIVNSETITVKNTNNANLDLPNQETENATVVENNSVVYRVLRPEDLQLRNPTTAKTSKRGRPRRVQNDTTVDLVEKEEKYQVPVKVFRTRSGRMTKPPRYIQQDLPNSVDNNPVLIEDNQIPVEDKPESQKQTQETSSVSPTAEHKRNISSQFRCTTCKKAYLGRSRMVKHLQLNPDHVGPCLMKSSTSNLWTELLKRSQNAPKGQRARTLCEEFSFLIQKARTVIPKLLKLELNENDSSFQMDQVMSDTLGLPIGKYGLDETVLSDELISDKYDDTLEVHTIDDCVQNSDSENCVQNNDQNSLLNLLDTGQVTFDSTASTEEVMNVDQLVNERLKTLTGGELEPPTNGSQNISLDLSLDMFSYHSN